MKKIIYSIFDYIRQSVYSKKEGKVSSTRMSSYFILGGILSAIAIFVSIELVNAIVLWKSGAAYIIPSEHIVIFGMVLAHHLTLLGINKNHETKVEQAVQNNLKSLNELNPKDITTTPPLDEKETNEEDMV